MVRRLENEFQGRPYYSFRDTEKDLKELFRFNTWIYRIGLEYSDPILIEFTSEEEYMEFQLKFG